MDVLDDPEELGRRIAAARGYAQMKRLEFAKLLGVSVPTLTRWEEGDRGSLGRSIEARRERAERTQRVSGAPPEVLGLEDPGRSTEERLVEVEGWVRELRQRVLGSTAEEIEEDEEREARRYRPNGESSEEQGPEEASG